MVATERPTKPMRNAHLHGPMCLFERYGVLTREVVALEPSCPSWAELVPLLSRAEWRGELRRGYFVEGLSGVQYASDEAAAELGRAAALGGLPARSQPGFEPSGLEPAPPASNHGSAQSLTFVCAADPANIYGAGAPLDIELLEGASPAAAHQREFPGRARRPAGLDHRIAAESD